MGYYFTNHNSLSYKIGHDASYKYDDDEGTRKYKDESDLWINVHTGILIPKKLPSFFIIEIRYGYNLMNGQWSSSNRSDYTTTSIKWEFEPKRAYDIALYIGGGITL